MNTIEIQTFTFAGDTVVQGVVQASPAAGLPAVVVTGLSGNREAGRRLVDVFRTLGVSPPPNRLCVHVSVPGGAVDGREFDLAIAMAALGAIGVLSRTDLAGWTAYGGLAGLSVVSPTGRFSVPSISEGRRLICAKGCER